MQHMILIYADETEEQRLSEDEWQSLIEQHNSFATRHGSIVVASEALEPTAAAKTLRKSPSGIVVTDGPFAETKEQLGGFFLIEADTIDNAVELAKELPLAEYGSIEVRPVLQM